MCIGPAVFRRPCFLGLLHPLWHLQSFHLLFHRVPSGLVGGFVEDTPFRIGFSKIAQFLHIVCLWVCLFVPVYNKQKEASLMMAEQTVIYD